MASLPRPAASTSQHHVAWHERVSLDVQCTNEKRKKDNNEKGRGALMRAVEAPGIINRRISVVAYAAEVGDQLKVCRSGHNEIPGTTRQHATPDKDVMCHI